jgi:hypothetical protein
MQEQEGSALLEAPRAGGWSIGRVVVQRLASGKAFVEPVPVGDALFSEFPAQIRFLTANETGEVNQPLLRIFHQATCPRDRGKHLLQLGNDLRALLPRRS